MNEDSSNLTKAVVKNLTAKHISKLANRPEATLEYFHNVIQKPDKSENTDKVEKSRKTSRQFEMGAFFTDECDKILNNANISMLDNMTFEKEMEKEMEWELIHRNKESIDMFPNTDERFRMEDFEEDIGKPSAFNEPTKKDK